MARNDAQYSPRRILVIDDDPAVRASLRMMLEYEGYQIVAAISGSEGLALVEGALPDLVLLDVEMPGLDGLEVLKRLHTRHESLPVVMISGHRTPAIALEARRCGAVDFLEKPFESANDLLATICEAVAGSRGVSGS
jgi:two-component system nitrogen regulation response regulator NtrX